MAALTAIIRALVLSVVVLAIATGNAECVPQRASMEELVGAVRGYEIAGPEGEVRRIWVWRLVHANAEAPLPVLYLGDGLNGLGVALLGLKRASDAGVIAPFMVISVDPASSARVRRDEYIRGERRHERYRDWLVGEVMPWAERFLRASPERDHRFIGGNSFGADFALSLASERPDLFAGALLHSPVLAQVGWLSGGADRVRWVVSGGRGENQARDIARALMLRGAPVRRCFGNWPHHVESWLAVSPGSIGWLMRLGPNNELSTAVEESRCTDSDASARQRMGATTP